MKRIAAAVFGVLAFVGVAYAQDTSMPNNDNNTFVVTEPNGAVLRYHFNHDGTWDMVAPDGQTANGTFAINGDQVCMTGAGETQAQCVANNTNKNVGDTWTQKDANGADISVTLVAGRP